MEKKPTIYCISGLGADEKIFAKLQLKGYDLKYIPWLQPNKNEKIDEYAKRMALAIHDDAPILLGVSFGGMMGIEIARLMPVKKLFIVSSIKSVKEMPAWMRWAGSLKLNKIVPLRSYKLIDKIGIDRLGVTTKEERELVRNYRKNVDLRYLDWAIQQIVKWKNNWQPDHIVHIHGNKDKIFPVKRISGGHIIKNGTHLMIYNRADEISRLIEQELDERKL